MGPNLFWKFKTLKKPFLRPTGPGIRNSPGPEKRWTTRGLKCSGQQFNFNFLISACLGTLTPKNLEKESNFRLHLKNLKMAFVLQNHHQDPYWFCYNAKKKHPFLRRFLGFSNFPLMGVNLFWKFKILKKAFLRPTGPGIRNSPGPEKRWTTRGLKCSGQQLNF